MKNILITGANGQLGNEIRVLSAEYPEYSYFFTDVEELNKTLKELKEELFNLRFQNATNQLDNPKRIVSVKKDIAKAKTVLKEKELGINTSVNA